MPQKNSGKREKYRNVPSRSSVGAKTCNDRTAEKMITARENHCPLAVILFSCEKQKFYQINHRKRSRKL